MTLVIEKTHKLLSDNAYRSLEGRISQCSDHCNSITGQCNPWRGLPPSLSVSDALIYRDGPGSQKGMCDAGRAEAIWTSEVQRRQKKGREWSK